MMQALIKLDLTMDEQIQSILNEALSPQQTPDQTPQADPVSSILQSAGVAPQTPTDVTNAQGKLGNTDDNGYCETFVEKMAGLPNMGTTANEAFNNFSSQGKAYSDVSKAPAGSLIYFAPDSSNGNAGHVAVTDGEGNIIGATYNGVEQHGLDEWMKKTGQKPLGYVIP